MIGLYTAVVLLLAAAGIAKAWRPQNAAAALQGLGLTRKPELAVRVVAIAEVSAAAAAIFVAGALPPLAIAVFYLAFAATVTELLRRGHRSVSCGCFGQASAEVSVLHVVLDLGATAVAIWIALSGMGINDLTARSPGDQILIVTGALVASYLLYLAMTILPAVYREALREKDEPSRTPGQFQLVTNRTSPRAWQMEDMRVPTTR